MPLPRLLIALLWLALSLPARAEPFPNSRFETIDGVRVHVRAWPATGPERGCPILLVHGFAGSTFAFRDLAPALAAAGHPVWALDLPAYGYSARVPFPTTAGAALAPWLRQTRPGQRWCLLGHSMGTRVVGELVQRMPGEIAGVAYVDGNPILTPAELRKRERYKSPTFRRWVSELVELRYLNAPKVGELLEKAYGREPTAAEIAGYLTPLQQPGTALAILTGYSALWPDALDPKALDRVPSLILWGEHDRWVKDEVADRLQSDLPSARRVTIAGAGHCPMETHVAASRDALLALFGR